MMNIYENIDRYRKSYEDIHPDCQISLEKVIKKGSSIDVLKQQIIEEMSKLSLKKSCLVIIDYYIFPDNASENYINFLSNLLIENVHTKNVRFVTSNKYNKGLYEKINRKLCEYKFKVSIKHSENYHDRLWLTEKAGFVMGTSLNGLGKKLSLLLPLDESDHKEIYENLIDDGMIK